MTVQYSFELTANAGGSHAIIATERFIEGHGSFRPHESLRSEESQFLLLREHMHVLADW